MCQVHGPKMDEDYRPASYRCGVDQPKPLTPEQLQAHAEALGYPWVGMNKSGDWNMFRHEPFNEDERWRVPFEPTGLRHPIYSTVIYSGRWQDSLRGPKEAKR